MITYDLDQGWAIYFSPRAVSKIFLALCPVFFKKIRPEFYIFTSTFTCIRWKTQTAARTKGLGGPDSARGTYFAHPWSILNTDLELHPVIIHHSLKLFNGKDFLWEKSSFYHFPPEWIILIFMLLVWEKTRTSNMGTSKINRKKNREHQKNCWKVGNFKVPHWSYNTSKLATTSKKVCYFLDDRLG